MQWVIMNAQAWIGGKPTVQKIIEENGHDGVIMVGKKDGKEIFILGSGDKAYAEDGAKVQYKLDTGNGYRGGGTIEVENAILISKTGVVNPGNSIGLDQKRKLYVFK